MDRNSNSSIFRYTYQILAAVLLLSSYPLLATEFFVDVNQNDDSGDGLTEATAKKHISSATTLMSIAGGDIVTILPGVYSDPLNALKDLGAGSAPIIQGGTSGNYNMVRAKTVGTVAIEQGLFLRPTGSDNGAGAQIGANKYQYIHLDGLKWRFPEGRAISGNHLKITRCAFNGSFANTNTNTLAIGTADFDAEQTGNIQTNPIVHGAEDILIEDSWFYGRGGRYNLSMFHANRVVVRRVLVRHDGGWDDSLNGSDPEACITTYNSANVKILNSICLDSRPENDFVLDGDGNPTAALMFNIKLLEKRSTPSNNWQEFENWTGAFLIVSNPASSNQDVLNAENIGSIALNVQGPGFAYEDSATISATLRDGVAWDTGSCAINNNNKNGTAPHTIVASNMLIHAQTDTFNVDNPGGPIQSTSGRAVCDPSTNNGPDDIKIDHSMVLHFTNPTFSIAGITAGCNYCINTQGLAEGNCTAGTDIINFDPIANNEVKFPLQIEAGGTLKTANGFGCGEIGPGANAAVGSPLLLRVGVNGSMLPDSGAGPHADGDWNKIGGTAGTEELWPWPYESLIKRDLSEVADVGVRGWTATDKTLTEYIWEYLGNSIGGVTLPSGNTVAISAPPGVAVD
ncbi:MAG: hypothetical protein JKY89_06100 [Immundisolibacteraceae bacterium]|nr:hypothetical protein [Immundisolibacteraceae bacterium]